MIESACSSPEVEEAPLWVSQGGVILIILCLLQCFWGLSRVCDHYFCESMKVLCDRNKISAGMAGAVFMAVGSSAPDLIISMLALFLGRSTLGLGTIIGSEVFEHLVVSAACVLSSQTGRVQLDRGTFTVICAGYLFCLILLMILLKDGSFKRREFVDCLSVEWYDGFVLMCAYGVYCFLLIKFESSNYRRGGSAKTIEDTTNSNSNSNSNSSSNSSGSSGVSKEKGSRSVEHGPQEIALTIIDHKKRASLEGEKSNVLTSTCIDSQIFNCWFIFLSIYKLYTFVNYYYIYCIRNLHICFSRIGESIQPTGCLLDLSFFLFLLLLCLHLYVF